MDLMPVSDLQPDMKLAKDVFDSNGTLILPKDFPLSEKYIDKLINMKVNFVFVKKDDEIDLSYLNDENTKFYSQAYSNFNSVFSDVSNGKSINSVLVKETIQAIVSKVLDDEFVFSHLSNIRNADSDTYVHSIDVCIHSILTGQALGLSNCELVELGIGAALHDIGKCQIPSNILKKSSELSQDEYIVLKLHPTYGHEIILNSPGLPSSCATVSLRHHERLDGSGYPEKLKGYEIDYFSKIIMVADVFNSMICGKPYLKKALPSEATKYIVGNSSFLFDQNIVATFFSNVPAYPIGAEVVLNTGEAGVIIETNNNSLRPKVKVMFGKDSDALDEYIIIDLKKNFDYYISELLT